ncbi:MarR family winged helix-turn-helix transcriptional regulator [Nonomuraea zeae]|uniref:Winged helix-turn-helix transcriptional regulator n=1 Tax=Nonomuraea zeae TaxID=1642303 RepID=A0A5S4FGL5_9ACTN|nr:MarR family winged helix-turn-helix transcriptional regulator [Nonomuraea zeae]TMR18666.1 winged helix-turn-helix transcriptional regulator [Nonomuraea zeae]
MAEEAGEQLGIVTALVRSAFLVNAVYAESAREYGLTPQQGQLICVLMAQPYGMSGLGAVLGLAKSSLTELVDRTTQRGLVRREPDPRDGRAVRVVLTAQGGKLAEAFHAEACRRIAELPAGLGGGERDALAALLSQMVQDNQVPKVFVERDQAAGDSPPVPNSSANRPVNRSAPL